MTRPDEKWTNGHTGEPYWRTSTVGDDRWIIIHGAPERPQNAPGRPQAVQTAIADTPDPTSIPMTRAGRIRNLVMAVRNGDRSAVDALRNYDVIT